MAQQMVVTYLHAHTHNMDMGMGMNMDMDGHYNFAYGISVTSWYPSSALTNLLTN